MVIEILKAKIHRATVTEANLNYIGSLTLNEDLMDSAGMQEYEKIQVLDITNGNRIETYIIHGKRGSGNICINGVAAHLIHKGDMVIILSYCQLNDAEIPSHTPCIVHVNEKNQIIHQFSEEPILV